MELSSLSSYWNAFSEECEVGDEGPPPGRAHADTRTRPRSTERNSIRDLFLKKSNTEVNSQGKNKKLVHHIVLTFHLKVKQAVI